MLHSHVKLSYTQMIMLSFFLIIALGALLLTLPFASRSGEWTNFLDALFTATSATCVTGLAVLDTYTHWSAFGQLVILTLIQIGGLGVMTCVAILALIFKRRFSVGERRLLMQSAGANQRGGIVKLIRRIIRITLIVETFGTILLFIAFIPDMPFIEALWKAVFHAISAFCNAGFDLFGTNASLLGTDYAMNPLVNITLMLLIVTGGIGFIVWGDVLHKGTHFKQYETHTKIVLVTTAVLIFSGAFLFYIFEANNTLSGLSTGDKILSSFFLSVTPRTAGFSTLDLTLLSNSGALFTILFMFIGGSPGSTAGGIKTTTFVVILLSALTSARRYGSITVFKRKLDSDTVVKASAIASLYLLVVCFAVIIIAAVEPAPFVAVLFECVSAIGTVGLSMGITSSLSDISQVVLILLMYMGRIGGLSLMLVLAENSRDVPIERPSTKILIG